MDTLLKHVYFSTVIYLYLKYNSAMDSLFSAQTRVPIIYDFRKNIRSNHFLPTTSFNECCFANALVNL